MTGGSSPWVRRTPNQSFSQLGHFRFISVGTENTQLRNKILDPQAVHLRGYGEHHRLGVALCPRGGSSPWVRRTLRVRDTVKSAERFISVGTENTSAQIAKTKADTVHLRGYGEHSKNILLIYNRKINMLYSTNIIKELIDINQSLLRLKFHQP